MKEYKVELSRAYYTFGEIIVKANDEQQAEEIAMRDWNGEGTMKPGDDVVEFVDELSDNHEWKVW